MRGVTSSILVDLFLAEGTKAKEESLSGPCIIQQREGVREGESAALDLGCCR